MNKSRRPLERYELGSEIEEQLRINESQKYQLRDLLLRARHQLRTSTMGILVLGTAFIVILLVLPLQPSYEDSYRVRELLPAACILLGFGLYQAVTTFHQYSAISNELRSLLECENEAIEEARAALKESENEDKQ